MSEQEISILMFHSISDGPGPTCLSPPLFRQQMAVLADCGYRGVSVADYTGWRQGERDLPDRFVVLTFDDGFEDFATVAFPELRARGWRATVFVPTGKVGGTDDWEARTKGQTGRRLMSWATIRGVADAGADIGAHGVTHADLTSLEAEHALNEVASSRQMIEAQVGCRVRAFAYPYGRTNAYVKSEVRKSYMIAVGTILDLVRPTSDMFNLPRIEMWYLRDLKRWRDYVEGGRTRYFRIRQSLRRLRSVVSR